MTTTVRRVVQGLVVAVGLGTGIPQPARASDELCAPTAIKVCVTAQFALTNSHTLDLWLFNGSSGVGVNNYSVLTGFGMAGLPTTGTWSLTQVGFNDWNGATLLSDGNTGLASLGGWAFATGGGLNSIGLSLVAGAQGPGGNGGISTCDGPPSDPPNNPKWLTCEGDGAFGGNDDWMRFTFSYTGNDLTQGLVDALNWGYKVQDVEQPIDGKTGQSYECNTLSTSDKFCDLTGDGGGGPEEVVPEPASMSLMALGLAGLAATRRRKRRA